MVRIVPMEAHIESTVHADELLLQIEKAGRTCYKSEGKIGDGSAHKFIRGIIARGHESVLEHGSISVRFTVDRGVTHELVRHRLASYSQESTRYCNYGNERFDGGITVCQPNFWDFTGDPDVDFVGIHHGDANTRELRKTWMEAMEAANGFYLKLIALGAKPQEARSVLPQSTKAEIVASMNPREWRHYFRMRCSPAAHPDIRKVSLELLDEMHSAIPVLFDDLYEEFFCKMGETPA